ncbi:MAG: IclR family transcriptional regulator [Marinifilaceae bacterium]
MRAEQEEISKYNVPMLIKGIELLEELSHHHRGLTMQEMGQLLNFPKTTVFRLANTLLDMGYLGKDADNNRYFLSRKLFKLGLSALGETNIVERAMEPMTRLRDDVKESVMLGVLVDTEVVLLEQILGSHAFTFVLKTGTSICVHASAPGKVLMANLSTERRENIIERISFYPFNDNTITCREQFMNELKRVKEQGYAMDIEEEIIGVHCIGAPIHNQDGEVIACVWMTGPKGRMPHTVFPELSGKVRACADEISLKLGYKETNRDL